MEVYNNRKPSNLIPLVNDYSDKPRKSIQCDVQHERDQPLRQDC